MAHSLMGRHSLMGWVCLFVCLFSASMFSSSSSSSPLYLLPDISNNGLLLYWTSLHCHWKDFTYGLWQLAREIEREKEKEKEMGVEELLCLITLPP
jgi:hypothetical protein